MRVLLCLLMLSACASAPEKPTVKLTLDWLPNPNHVPLYVGLEKGFFQEVGIDLEILKTPDVVDGIFHVISNQSDLAISYMPSVIQAIEQGAKVQPVGKLIEKPLNCLIYYQDGTINTPQDLSNKTLGYSLDGTTHTLDTLLENNAITPSKKLNCHFDLTGMFLSRQVDMLYGAYWNIESVQLTSENLPCEHFTLEELGIPTYHELIIISKQGKQYDAFLEALHKSITFCQKNPDEAFTLYAALNPDKGQETLKWEKKAWILTLPLLPTSPQIDPTIWNNYKSFILG